MILTADGEFNGALTLTASAAPTFAEIAGMATALAGRPVELLVMQQDAWVARQVAAGQPDYMARFTLGLYEAAREGYFAGVDPLLGTLLGREPKGVREVLEPLPTAHGS